MLKRTIISPCPRVCGFEEIGREENDVGNFHPTGRLFIKTVANRHRENSAS